MGLVTCAAMAVFSAVIFKQSRAGTVTDRQVRTFTLRMLLAVQFMTAIVTSFTLLLPLPIGAARFAPALPIVIGLFLVGIFASVIHGMRQLSTSAGDLTPDACWKGGPFYYNPNDPAVLVEKRFGFGYTLNFGNRWSWIVLGLLMLPAVATVAAAVLSTR